MESVIHTSSNNSNSAGDYGYARTGRNQREVVHQSRLNSGWRCSERDAVIPKKGGGVKKNTPVQTSMLGKNLRALQTTRGYSWVFVFLKLMDARRCCPPCYSGHFNSRHYWLVLVSGVSARAHVGLVPVQLGSQQPTNPFLFGSERVQSRS